ncbi:MAG: hypothetical protein ABIE55_01380 [Candidatus Aenigmatarchaeota archaeon]
MGNMKSTIDEFDLPIEEQDARFGKIIYMIQSGEYKIRPNLIKEMGNETQKRIENLKYKKQRRKTVKILSHLNLLDDIEKNGKRIWEGDYKEVNEKLEQIPEDERRRITSSFVYI